MPAVARLASVGEGAGFRHDGKSQMDQPRMKRIYTDEDSGSCWIFQIEIQPGKTMPDTSILVLLSVIILFIRG
jgi:hypothetical protein